MKSLTGIFACFAALLTVMSASATEVVRWQRVPLAIPLHVDQERILFVDRPVRVAVPASLTNRLRVQSADGAVYLRATTPFDSTRIELQDVDTGTLMLLDVSAVTADLGDQRLEPIRIQSVPASGSQNATVDTSDPTQSGPSTPTAPTPAAVLLTRYAAQSLHAPLRTIEPVPGITPVPLHPRLNLTTLLPSQPLNVTALGAWRLDNEWVTALRITNTASQWVTLDPRALQGDFQAATFQHNRVGPQGNSSDTTALYLVTHGHGLIESLLPAMSRVDVSTHVPPRAEAGTPP